MSAAPARAQCPYCGVGCGLELKPQLEDPSAAASEDPPGWSVRGDRSHPSSLGQVCVKGATVAETLHHNRLTTPQWRERLDQPFTPISWERAFTILVQRIRTTLASRGPAALAIYGSGQFLTEDYYVANKLLEQLVGYVVVLGEELAGAVDRQGRRPPAGQGGADALHQDREGPLPGDGGEGLIEPLPPLGGGEAVVVEGFGHGCALHAHLAEGGGVAAVAADAPARRVLAGGSAGVLELGFELQTAAHAAIGALGAGGRGAHHLR